MMTTYPTFTTCPSCHGYLVPMKHGAFVCEECDQVLTWKDSDELYCVAIAARLEAAGLRTAGYTQTGGNVHCVILPQPDGSEWLFGLADEEWAGCLNDADGVGGDVVLPLAGLKTSGDKQATPAQVAQAIINAIVKV